MLFAYRCEGCGEVAEILSLASEAHVVLAMGLTERCRCDPKPDAIEASLRPIAGPPFVTVHDVVRWIPG